MGFGRRKVEITRRGLRMAPEKVRRRGLHCLPPVSIVVLFFLVFLLIFFYFIFCDLNV